MSQVIPEGWFLTPLETIATWGSGGTPSRKVAAYYGGNVPWIKTGDLGDRVVTNASEFITDEAVENSSAKWFPKGSVVLAMYGATIGKTSILGLDATTNQACGVGHPIEGVTFTEFLYYFLCNEKDAFIAKGKGGAQPNISQALIKAHHIALPPLAEQKVIAEKLDELLARVESTKTRLDAIPVILRSFRQSVLAAAVSGKLTEEWRGENECEAVKKLIEKNAAKKNGKLKVPKKSKWDQDIDLFDLPNGWSWIENHKLAIDSNTAICAGPFGTIFKAKDFRESGVPIIFLRHVKESGFNQRKPNYMDDAVWSEFHQDYSIYGGELLVTKLGDPPGESCIYPNDFGTAMVTPDVLKMNVDAEVADIKYLMYFFNSPISKKMVGDAAFGATRLRIDIPLFKSFPIPLPPRDEQAEIVRRIEELFAFADKIEAQVNAAQLRVNNLTQSILAKGFKGELTSDWRAANSELISGENSAEALLERIKAERGTLVNATKGARKKLVKKVIAKNTQDTVIDKKMSPVESAIANGLAHKPQEIFDQLTPDLSMSEVFNEISKLLSDNKIEEKTVDGITGFFVKR